jgi:DNA/RNA-binding protein KIN17
MKFYNTLYFFSVRYLILLIYFHFQWQTLNGFVKYLGKKGVCVVDETEKGWNIQWIRRDAIALARNAELERMDKSKMDDDERERRRIEAIVNQAREEAEAEGRTFEVEATDITRDADAELIKIEIAKKPSSSLDDSKKKSSGFSFDQLIATKLST